MQFSYIIEAFAKPPAHLVGSRVPRDRGRAGRASLPGFASASIICENGRQERDGTINRREGKEQEFSCAET